MFKPGVRKKLVRLSAEALIAEKSQDAEASTIPQ